MLEDAFLRHLPHRLADVIASAFFVLGSLPACAELASTLVDYVWYGTAFALQWVPGARALSRRLMARALRLDAPTFGISVTPIDTATVNDGRDTLRGTLWLPAGPRAPSGPFPVVIIRTPYGQRAHLEVGQGVLAERGYAVLYQNTRGRCGSDGEFVPVEHERADGAATVRWVRAQPWCNGRVAVCGFSYLGFTAWACVGACAPGELQAAIPLVSQSRIHSAAFVQGGALSLELVILWLFLVLRVLATASPLAQARAWLDAWRGATFSRAQMHTPLRELDRLLLGKHVAFIRGALAHPDADGPFWRSRDKLCDIADVAARGALPTMHIVTGWYDFFVHECLRDFELVCAAQPDARLTVGAHDHWGIVHLPHLQHAYRCLLATLDQAVGPALPRARVAGGVAGRAAGRGADDGGERAADGAKGSAHAPLRRAYPALHGFASKRGARGRRTAAVAAGAASEPAEREAELELPVQICMLGSGRWKGYARWPPGESRDERLWLTAHAGLSNHAPADAPPARAAAGGAVGPHRRATLSYAYDPADPTPSCGGPAFNPLNSGARNQRALERRRDMLIFSSEPMRRHVRIVGHVRLRLRVSSSAHSIDLVARLCEASPLLGSTNICEGVVRLRASPPAAPPPTLAAERCNAARIGGEDGIVAVVELGPVGVDFSAGSRVRLHVCSAAHPRWMRNLNSASSTPLEEQMCGPPSTQQIWVDCADSFLVLPVDS